MGALGIFGGKRKRNALSGYPANTYSDDTKRLQTNTNKWLVLHGFKPLTVDGILGQKTCGGVRKAGIPIPSTCGGFVEPSPGSYPWGAYSADTKATQAELKSSYPALVADGVLGPATCGALKALSQYGIVVPSTCKSFTAPTSAAAALPDSTTTTPTTTTTATVSSSGPSMRDPIPRSTTSTTSTTTGTYVPTTTVSTSTKTAVNRGPAMLAVPTRGAAPVTTAAPVKAGMSPGLKIGIAASAVALVAFTVLSKRKKAAA